MAYLIPQFWANSCCIALVTHKEPLAIFPKCFSILSKYPNFVLLAQFTNQMLNPNGGYNLRGWTNYQWYKATNRLFLPRDNARRVYPKLCQSITNAERLIQLANFTATSVGTDGGFWERSNTIISWHNWSSSMPNQARKHLTEHNGHEDFSLPEESLTTSIKRERAFLSY